MPSAARRLSPLGCALVVVAAVALPGCGGSGDATADSTTVAAPGHSGTSAPAANPGPQRTQPCPVEVGAFVDSLDRLRRQLAVGLSYDQYRARVTALRAGYEKLPIGRLGLACLATTGTPGERAFDKYVDAANAWGECLADASCDTTTIEPILQRQWRHASDALSAAQ